MSDNLLAWRARFPALEECVHLISHSLGCMPAAARERLAEMQDLWERESIHAWDSWLPEVDRCARLIERLLSAPEGTVVMHTNVSQIEVIVASCFEYTPERNKIVFSALNFPSVSYVWKAQERLGAECVIVPSEDGITVDAEAMCAAIDERTVAVPISHVLYSSAAIQDAARICRRAGEVGAHVVLDCYQSLGAMPVDIVDIGASFACGGSVKYLCGGPGAGWLYVRDDLIDGFAPRATGWFAHESPFAFAMPSQEYADGIWRFMGGTPNVSALYQARAGYEIVAEIGGRAIRDKSRRLTAKIVEAVDARGFTLRSPRDPDARGGSVVFDFTGAADVVRELGRRRVFCDYRPGAGVRVGPHFYTKDEEIAVFFRELDTVRGAR